MDKKADIKVLVTTFVTLLPVILGVNNNYTENLLLILVAAIILAGFNVLISARISKYEKSRDNININLYHCRWIIPIISIVALIMVIFYEMRIQSSLYYILMSIIGIFVCSSGIKLIECKNEENCSFKLPAILKNMKVNSKRFDAVGYIWAIAGLAFISLVYLQVNWFVVGLFLWLTMFITPIFIFNFVFKNN